MNVVFRQEELKEARRILIGNHQPHVHLEGIYQGLRDRNRGEDLVASSSPDDYLHHLRTGNFVLESQMIGPSRPVGDERVPALAITDAFLNGPLSTFFCATQPSQSSQSSQPSTPPLQQIPEEKYHDSQPIRSQPVRYSQPQSPSQPQAQPQPQPQQFPRVEPSSTPQEYRSYFEANAPLAGCHNH